MATLAIAVLLLIAITIISFTAARSGILDQRITGNALQQTLAHGYAEALLEDGTRQLVLHLVPAISWTEDPQDSDYFTLSPVPGAAVAEVLQQQVDSHHLVLRRRQDHPDFVEMTAEVVMADGMLARITQYVHLQWPLYRELPPMVLDGCISASGSGITLHPGDVDDISLASTRDAAGCIDSTALFLNGGHAQGDYLDGASFWDGLFRISKDELRTRSEWEQTAVESGAMVAAQRRYYWVNDPGEDWYQQPGFPGGPILGSPMHPVWILFGPDAECPPLGSELVIYGLVYYETGDSGQCDASGWGSVQVYGSVLVEGDLVMPGGGGSFMHYEYAEEQGLLAHLPPIRVARVPGTWRDF